MSWYDVPDQPLNPPERDYLQERIDRDEALADQYYDEQRSDNDKL